jgi:hypothetical protein
MSRTILAPQTEARRGCSRLRARYTSSAQHSLLLAYYCLLGGRGLGISRPSSSGWRARTLTPRFWPSGLDAALALFVAARTCDGSIVGTQPEVRVLAHAVDRRDDRVVYLAICGESLKYG